MWQTGVGKTSKVCVRVWPFYISVPNVVLLGTVLCLYLMLLASEIKYKLMQDWHYAKSFPNVSTMLEQMSITSVIAELTVLFNLKAYFTYSKMYRKLTDAQVWDTQGLCFSSFLQPLTFNYCLLKPPHQSRHRRKEVTKHKSVSLYFWKPGRKPEVERSS